MKGEYGIILLATIVAVVDSFLADPQKGCGQAWVRRVEERRRCSDRVPEAVWTERCPEPLA
jgi:hypothetical protein